MKQTTERFLKRPINVTFPRSKFQLPPSPHPIRTRRCQLSIPRTNPNKRWLLSGSKVGEAREVVGEVTEAEEEIGEVKVEVADKGEAGIKIKVAAKAEPSHAPQDTPQTLLNSVVIAITPTEPTRGTAWRL